MKHRLQRTPVLLLENADTNSKSAPMIQRSLPEYDITFKVVEPSDSCFGVISRRRTFWLCSHRERTRRLCDWRELYNDTSAYLRSCAQTTARDCVISEPWDIASEEAWLASSRKREMRLICTSWEYLLTHDERRRLTEFDDLRKQREAHTGECIPVDDDLMLLSAMVVAVCVLLIWGIRSHLMPNVHSFPSCATSELNTRHSLTIK
jgi:hypothetical protein